MTKLILNATPSAGIHQSQIPALGSSAPNSWKECLILVARLIATVALVCVLGSNFVSTANAFTAPMTHLVICPLTGEALEFTPSYGSFTSLGRSLDFEPLVMGMLRSSPNRIPQCADSGLPIYRAFKADEIDKLQSMVQTPAWKERLAMNNSSYLVAYTRYVLGETELSIANSLLSAAWHVTPQNKELILGQAFDAWSRIAETRQQHDQDWVAANWLRVELNRQRGEFERADYWLRDFEQRLGSDHAPVTDGMISLERQLITNRNSDPAAFKEPGP